MINLILPKKTNDVDYDSDWDEDDSRWDFLNKIDSHCPACQKPGYPHSVMFLNGTKPAITIWLCTGDVDLEPDMTMSEAAEKFWLAVRKMNGISVHKDF